MTSHPCHHRVPQPLLLGRFPGAGHNRWKALAGCLSLFVGMAVWGLPTRAWGAGFALMQQGAAAMAQANAFVAEANDPSAIFYNPAGLNQLKRPEVYTGKFFQYPIREYDGPGNYYAQTHPHIYGGASIFLVFPVQERVVLGVGAFAPFGLGSIWPPSWAGRYITTYSKLQTYNVNPVISVKLLDNLSVAGGVNFLWSVVQLKRRVPVVLPPGLVLPDGEANVSGTGTGVGGNFGILYEPRKGVKLGASYRSAIRVDHTGDLNLSLPIRIPGLAYNTGGKAKLVYPPMVNFGVSLNLWKPLTVNLDATWTGWSTYDSLAIKLDNVILANNRFTNSLVTEKNWRDAWAFRLGLNWKVKDHAMLRAGYSYDMTPVPDATLEPQVPDANRHILAIGKELKIWRLTLGMAYNCILFEPRRKSNWIATNGVALPAAFQANGTYRTINHSLGLSTALHF